ncbi:hypothetical protein [Paenibacillus sp. L3-i20]|uniref:hypothetical protein n=1 Tax=Paenibacillus sp. L3-i20 TaxID=2905833 RepID=UPI001EE0BEED|nr:hypothetical protein [Paenibacillus sp. L3-i20]GKU77255.1 hypothetical protein L3i20_v216520 [Paenibacillus sp. L3-i20]
MTGVNHNTVRYMVGKLFAGERLLVMVGLLGLVLAAISALYIGFNGATILPEGNIESVFSFDAALGLFALSIAAIMPLANLSSRNRAIIRWLFIQSALYAYAVETIQHFRGINPRFSEVGTTADTIFGALFGLESFVLIIATVLLAISFFRRRGYEALKPLVLSIRYAFVSTMAAFAGGIWMIALQSRYTGDAGNLIVLHGLGFHALQALPLLGWLLMRSNMDAKITHRWVHIGSISWTLAILFVAIQTVLGRTLFELTLLPILSLVMLLAWLSVAAVSARKFLSGESLFKPSKGKDRGLS